MTSSNDDTADGINNYIKTRTTQINRCTNTRTTPRTLCTAGETATENSSYMQTNLYE